MLPGNLAEIVDEFAVLSPAEQDQLAAPCKKLGRAAAQAGRAVNGRR